jgi:hypothetical protein
MEPARRPANLLSMARGPTGGCWARCAVIAVAVASLPVFAGTASVAQFAQSTVPAGSTIGGSARRDLPTPCGGYGSPGPSSLPQFVSAIDFDGARRWVLALPAPLSRRALEHADTGAALAQLKCVHGAVWAVYTGFGAAMSQAPWFAYHGSAEGWQPVFSEGYTEVGLSAKFTNTAPAGYPGPFSALSATSAVFLGDNVGSSPVSTVIDRATASGRQLRRAGIDPDVTTATGVAFTSSADGWISGEHVTSSCSNRTVPSCPWVIDRTVDGGATWRRVFSYTP